MHTLTRLFITAALLLALPACQQSEPPGPAHTPAAQTPRTEAGVAGTPAKAAETDALAGGRNVARNCASCHHFDTSNSIGPGLGGIFNRKAGSMPGYTYRFTAYIAPGKAWRWDAAHLAAWVCNSKMAVRKFTGDNAAETSMPVQGLCDPAVQAELIAYLKTL